MSKPIIIKDRHGKPYAFGQFGTSVLGGNVVPLRNKSELIRVLNQLPFAGRVPQPLAALARTNQPDQLFQAIRQGRIKAWELAPQGKQAKDQDTEAEDGEIDQLRDQVRLTLARIIAAERQEFDRINPLYEEKSILGKVVAHHKAYYLGMWESAETMGSFLFSKVRNVYELISVHQRMLRTAKAMIAASHEQGWDNKLQILKEYNANEYKELVDVLGFDPTKIDLEVFSEAYHMASLLWDDTPTHYMLLEFGREYALAQHSTEWAGMAGGVAFEILLTAIITALTAGTGTVAVVAGSLARYMDEIASLGRLFSKLFKILSKRKKLSTLKVTSHKSSAARSSKISDYATDNAPIKPNNPPPAGPTQKTSTKSPDRKPTDHQQGDAGVSDTKPLSRGEALRQKYSHLSRNERRAIIDERLEGYAEKRLDVLEQSIPRAHFKGRHGAQTTLNDQYERAVNGIDPVTQQPRYRRNGSLVTRNSTRFISHRDQYNAIQRAKDIYKNTGSKVMAEKPIKYRSQTGEGFYGDTGVYDTSYSAQVWFNRSAQPEPITAFPILGK